MTGIVVGNGVIQAGQTVAWNTIVGERRGRVLALRSDGSVRVEVWDRLKGSWLPNGSTVDLPRETVRPMLAARVAYQTGRLEARAAATAIELFMYGDIGPGGGIEAPAVMAALAGKDRSSRLVMFLSSGGGSPIEAVAIAAQLGRWPGTKTLYIDGLAASAATIITCAANTVYMSPEAMFMIHRSWTLAVGDRDDMMATLEVLDQIDENMAQVYARRTGLSLERIREMMAKETWMNAEAAQRNGFVDAIVQPPQRNPGGARALMDRPWFTRNPDGSDKPLPHTASSNETSVSSQPAVAASALTPVEPATPETPAEEPANIVGETQT